MKKALVFAGSTSKISINKKLVTYASQLFKESHPDYQTEIIDLNDYEMTVFSVDKEKVAFPKEAYAFAQKIDECDFILVSLAEHNGSYTAAFKNTLDWVSRIPGREKAFGGKKMFIMATSDGVRGGGFVLEAATVRFPRNGAEVLGSFSLPHYSQNFVEGKGIINSDLNEKLKSELAALKV